MTRAEQLRKEADAIEAAELKAERLKTADTIPTCPDCGGRIFEIGAWTIATQSISFEDDESDGEWGEDYSGGDHSDQSNYATCSGCGENVELMLERFGWKFYGSPVEAPATPVTVRDPTDPAAE